MMKRTTEHQQTEPKTPYTNKNRLRKTKHTLDDNTIPPLLTDHAHKPQPMPNTEEVEQHSSACSTTQEHTQPAASEPNIEAVASVHAAQLLLLKAETPPPYYY